MILHISSALLEELGLNEAGHQEDLQPSLQWHLGNGRQAAGHVGELQVLRRGEVAIELSEDVLAEWRHGSVNPDVFSEMI